MSLKDRCGINVHLLNNPHLWAAAASLGVKWARIDLNWDTAQPAPDYWEWDVIDRAVSGARSHGLEVYATLSHSPAWSNAGAGRGAPPTSIIDWTRFVRAVGLRYGRQSDYGHIRAFGVWNEWAGSVNDYITLLFRPAAEVLRTMDAENVICGPELATEGDWSTWLSSFLLAAGSEVDVLTVHAYDDDGAAVWRKLTQARRWYEFWKKPSVREVIQKAGYGQKPCWVTEVGWESAKVGEDGQAQRWDQLLGRLQGSAWPSGICAYQLIDEPSVTFGLLREDFSAKPVAEVLRRYAGRGVI
jgi:hypothetical protein